MAIMGVANELHVMLTQQSLMDSRLRLGECFSPLVERKHPEVISFTSRDDFREGSAITQCSRSKPVTVENCAKLILNKSKLKQHCRNGVEPAVRKKLWLDVVGVNDADSVLLMKAFGGELRDDEEINVSGRTMHMGLDTDLTPFPSFHLRLANFTPGLERVLTAIHLKFSHGREGWESVEGMHAPLLPVLVHLMLHFIDEWQVFALLSHLLVRTAWLDRNKAECHASHLTLISFLRSHAHATLDALKNLVPDEMAQDVFLNELTQNWFLWPFFRQPFWIAVRVLDMFLVEGPKVMYRLAISALKLFASRSQKLTSDSGSSVVTAVQDLLCSVSSQQKARWFRDAFAIPRLSWISILSKWQSLLPAASSICEVDGADHESLGSLEEVDGSREHCLVIPDPSSELIHCPDHWYTLWSWFPEWVICEEPQCIFRASRDGYNLRTLYRKCEHYPYVLLLIKSNNGRTFGSFIASDLSDRHNNQFFGTGETFLFSLTPDVQCYKWSAETDLILRANDHELIVGSGGGAYGLWLDSDLNLGSSSTCTAFKNPPLCGPEGQFVCTSVEVYSCS